MAAIHYNENSENKQAKTAEGTLRFTPVFPKKCKGEVQVVKPVKENPTFSKWNWCTTWFPYRTLSKTDLFSSSKLLTLNYKCQNLPLVIFLNLLLAYVTLLLEAVIERRTSFKSYTEANEDAQVLMSEKPPSLTSGYNHTEKAELIARRRSRFAIRHWHL